MNIVKMMGMAALLLAITVTPAGAVEVQRVVSDKGIVAWLVEDHTNPIISTSFAFRGGAIADPQNKAGTANMVSGLLDEGAGDMRSYEFQKALEDKAIRLSFDANRDTFSGNLRTLGENRDFAFDMLRLALTQPRLDSEPIERIRAQILAGLARELQDPNNVAGRKWMATAFPAHPYGTAVSGTPESVRSIDRKDLHGFIEGRFARDNLIIGVSGDITAEHLKPLLDKAFGQLPEKAAPLAVASTTPAAAGKLLVEHRDIPQSVVVFGKAGIARKDPDWYAAYIMNYILGGGGFNSRLMEQVREKRGLAYSVSTYLQPLDYGALMAGGVATQNDRVAQSIEVIREEWRRLREDGPTNEELNNAKTYLTGSFPLQLTSTNAIAGILVSIQLDELGIDYLDRRNGLIERVMLDDVKRVAQRLLDPAQLSWVVVGNPAGLTVN